MMVVRQAEQSQQEMCWLSRNRMRQCCCHLTTTLCVIIVSPVSSLLCRKSVPSVTHFAVYRYASLYFPVHSICVLQFVAATEWFIQSHSVLLFCFGFFCLRFIDFSVAQCYRAVAAVNCIWVLFKCCWFWHWRAVIKRAVPSPSGVRWYCYYYYTEINASYVYKYISLLNDESQVQVDSQVITIYSE